MPTLNLIDARLSGITYNLSNFADGQAHIKIDIASLPAEKNDCTIITRLSKPDDLLLLLFAKDILHREGFERITLHISYLMAARMDRVIAGGSPFSLKVVAGIVNSAGFYKVYVLDPHSDVSIALLNDCYAINNVAFVKDAIADYKAIAGSATPYSIVSPDAGALKKIYSVAEALGNANVIECIKQRNITTGQISGVKVFTGELTGRVCFIVDDICDSGGTFIGVATELHRLGAAKIVVIVTHGIFSNGLPLQHVDKIYCTNSYKSMQGDSAYLTVTDVCKYLL